MNLLVVLCVVMVMCSTSVSALKCHLSFTDEKNGDDDYIHTECLGACVKINANIDGLFIDIITTH